jgi:hypothetical protein
VNIRHEILDWFGPSRGVIPLHSVLMYYAIEIDSSLFLSGFLKVFPECLQDVSDVDLSYLYIVEESAHSV